MAYEKSDTFKNFGNEVIELVASFGEQVSSALVTNIAPVIALGVIIYFTLSGWMALTGRAHNTIGDTAISCFKISLIAYFGLNAGNYIAYAIESIKGIETLLISSISGNNAQTAWDLLDHLMARISQVGGESLELVGNKFDGAWEKIKNANVIVPILFVIGLFWLAGIALIVSSIVILTITTVGFALLVGFGPLFICTLMFPYTRPWFDGWLRSAISLLMMNVMINSIAMITDTALNSYIAELTKLIDSESSSNILGEIFQEMILIICLFVTFVYLIKNITNFTTSLVGGINLNMPNPREVMRDLQTAAAYAGKIGGAVTGAPGAAISAAGKSAKVGQALSHPGQTISAGMNRMKNWASDKFQQGFNSFASKYDSPSAGAGAKGAGSQAQNNVLHGASTGSKSATSDVSSSSINSHNYEKFGMKK